MASFAVIYDANVLYPAPLRSVLMFLAQTDLFRARWTLVIHEEWGFFHSPPTGLQSLCAVFANEREGQLCVLRSWEHWEDIHAMRHAPFPSPRPDAA